MWEDELGGTGVGRGVRGVSASGYLCAIQSLIPQNGQWSVVVGREEVVPSTEVGPPLSSGTMHSQDGLGRFLRESISARDAPLSHCTENICSLGFAFL